MKNITLSAEDALITRARLKAQSEKTSLNQRFREWLRSYVGHTKASQDYDQLMKKFNYVQVDQSFTRDELNDR